MNKEQKMKFIKKLREKSPKFSAALDKKIQEKLRQKKKKSSGGPGLSDNLSLNTTDSVKFEIIKDKEV